MSVIFFCGFTFADDITVVRPLSLGTIAILDNSSPSDITIRLNGTTRTTNSIGLLVPGNPAEFLLTNFLPFRTLSITPIILGSETNSNAPEGSAKFTVIDLITEPRVVTDALGNASVFMGATFRTSGNPAEDYFDTDYTARVQLSIDY